MVGESRVQDALMELPSTNPNSLRALISTTWTAEDEMVMEEDDEDDEDDDEESGRDGRRREEGNVGTGEAVAVVPHVMRRKMENGGLEEEGEGRGEGGRMCDAEEDVSERGGGGEKEDDDDGRGSAEDEGCMQIQQESEGVLLRSLRALSSSPSSPRKTVQTLPQKASNMRPIG